MKQMILVLLFLIPLLSASAEPSMVTAKEIEVFGSEMTGQEVCMEGLFLGVDQFRVDLWEIEENMIGFTMKDSFERFKGDYFFNFMADKSKFARKLLSLEEDTPIRACGPIRMVPHPIKGPGEAEAFFLVNELTILSN